MLGDCLTARVISFWTPGFAGVCSFGVGCVGSGVPSIIDVLAEDRPRPLAGGSTRMNLQTKRIAILLSLRFCAAMFQAKGRIVSVDVARQSYAALQAGRRVFVPGLLNKLRTVWLRPAPHALTLAVMGGPPLESQDLR